MFSTCRGLKTIQGIENFNTSAATNLSSMFAYCNIEILPIENFNVSNVTTMANMFVGCIALKKLDLSKWRPSKVTVLNGTF